ncbi:hypothetical protein BH24PSE2_BH24PSE2_03770 [soil metagenome]
MQALYQWQLAGQSAAELCAQFDAAGLGGADADYFRELVEGVIAGSAELDARIGQFADREVARLDPVERAILLLAVYELEHRPDVPHAVVINEAVELGKRFGATEGHRYVNALLDRAARALREGP